MQKLRGHRYSVDDMLVAHLASTRCEAPSRVLDLGCGLGSVLLIVAWALPKARLVGLEALAEHVALANRNLVLNGCESRACIVAGDLRQDDLVDSLGAFDLVTGTPPYFDPASGTLCADPARAAAHFELRGGVEDYATAASRALAPGGLFVTCAAGTPPGRGREALRSAGLALLYHQQVVPRVGKPPFLTLLVGAHEGAAEAEEAPPLVLRNADGTRTPQHRAIRDWTAVSSRERDQV